MAGDVRTDEVLSTVERLFGEILPDLQLSGYRCGQSLQSAGGSCWKTVSSCRACADVGPELFAADDAVLDVTADLVANGRTSRLYRTLMHDQRRAAGLGAGQGSREMGSLFQIVATAAPDVTLEELRVAIMDEIGRLTNDGPTEAELDRARVQAEASFLFRLQTLGGFGGKADQLNAYNIYRVARVFDQDLDRYLRVTTSDVRRVAAQYLKAEQAVHLSSGAAGPAPMGPGGFGSGGGDHVTDTDRFVMPDAGSPARIAFPPIVRSTLPNQAQVWSIRHDSVPVVTIVLMVPVGSAHDPASAPGMAGVMADLLDEGTGAMTRSGWRRLWRASAPSWRSTSPPT